MGCGVLIVLAQVCVCRLLALNHERYQQEVEMGLHDKKRKPGGTRGGAGRRGSSNTRARKGATNQGDLF